MLAALEAEMVDVEEEEDVVVGAVEEEEDLAANPTKAHRFLEFM